MLPRAILTVLNASSQPSVTTTKRASGSQQA